MKKDGLDSKKAIAKAIGYVQKVRPYMFVFFLVFVACLYGLVVTKVNSLVSAQPSDDAVSSQVKAAKVPHFDQAVIKQLQSLQDNSVSVQTLFDDARNNPFSPN